MLRSKKAGETRTPEEIRAHYRVERELADRLRNASAQEREGLYAEVYNELFRRVPQHPQLTRKAVPSAKRRDVRRRMRWLRWFLRPWMTFLEIGAGDCALSFAAASHARRVIAQEVSAEITRQQTCPDNFELVLSSTHRVPLPPGSVDLAYSDQLIEHLHADDAIRHARDIHQALAPGGRYIFITPNRLSGPWDISRYFDTVATGLHLREYTFTELETLFQQAGFRRVRPYLGGYGLYVPVPAPAFRWMERALMRLPKDALRRLTNHRLVQIVLGTQAVAEKE